MDCDWDDSGRLYKVVVVFLRKGYMNTFVTYFLSLFFAFEFMACAIPERY